MSGRRFRAQDLKDLESFQDILTTAGTYLPLNFIMKLFNRMKSNPEGFDHHWLRNAVLVTRDMCDIHEVEEDRRSLIYAVTFLMETGRTYQGQHPHDASSAFAMVFLNEEAGEFFDDTEIKQIQNSCRRRSMSAFRLSVDTEAITIAHEVRVMTDVLFSNPAKAVVEYVRENTVITEEPVSPEEWCDRLSEGFSAMYGRNGTIWQSIPAAVLKSKPGSIADFMAVADNSALIGTLVRDNYTRIFGKKVPHNVRDSRDRAEPTIDGGLGIGRTAAGM